MTVIAVLLAALIPQDRFSDPLGLMPQADAAGGGGGFEIEAGGLASWTYSKDVSLFGWGIVGGVKVGLSSSTFFFGQLRQGRFSGSRDDLNESETEIGCEIVSSFIVFEEECIVRNTWTAVKKHLRTSELLLGFGWGEAIDDSLRFEVRAGVGAQRYEEGRDERTYSRIDTISRTYFLFWGESRVEGTPELISETRSSRSDVSAIFALQAGVSYSVEPGIGVKVAADLAHSKHGTALGLAVGIEFAF